jgi:tyrosine-specific transport protein
MKNKGLLALAILVGTIVGAGIFGIPYVISKSGIIPGFFYFFVLGGAVLLIHLLFGEVVLRTKENFRLIGFGQKYLGKWGKVFIIASVTVGVTGALLAYLIIGGKFLSILFSPVLDLSSFQFTIIFWLALSFFVCRGIKLIARAELFTNLFFFLAIIVILGFCLPKLDFSNVAVFDFSGLFLPFGVILFSLVGWSAISEVGDFLKSSQEGKNIKKTIILSSVMVVVLYILFAFSVVGVAGDNVSPDALSGLKPFLGQKVLLLGVLAGLITLADSFLVLALYLKNTFIFDLRASRKLATFLACGLPLFLFLIGFQSFIGTVGFVGTVVGVIEGTVIILMFKRAKTLGDREPEYSLKIPSVLLYFLIAVLLLGAVSQFL